MIRQRPGRLLLSIIAQYFDVLPRLWASPIHDLLENNIDDRSGRLPLLNATFPDILMYAEVRRMRMTADGEGAARA